MKTRSFLTFVATIPFLACMAPAASVGPAGYTNDFSSRPLAADWATASRVGNSLDAYDSDADVNANVSALAVNAQVVASTANPPSQNGSATWSTNGLYLQTRP